MTKTVAMIQFYDVAYLIFVYSLSLVPYRILVNFNNVGVDEDVHEIRVNVPQVVRHYERRG